MLLAPGLYERLIDEGVDAALTARPELRCILGKVEAEEEPARYAAFVAQVVEKALRLQRDSAARRNLCNQIIGQLATADSAEYLSGFKLVPREESLLLEVTPAHYAESGLLRPVTPLSCSSLLTGARNDPQLVHELVAEMRSADRLDVLVSFIKWSGLRLLVQALDELTSRGGKVRVITTSYMGASDAEAVEYLAQLPGSEVRVSYDTDRTRLHAKAYHVRRDSGFSTAYIGSANMSHAAMTSGLEWNLKVTAQDLPHILEKFQAEFDTYWNSQEFLPFDPSRPEVFREAIRHARNRSSGTITFFDLKPHPFQERILDALAAERSHGYFRNLVVAATGTGKTMVAAFDFKRFYEGRKRQAKLLFVAHRREILEQAVDRFRAILRITDFGELLVDQFSPTRYDHLFCSVQMLASRRLWEELGADFYDYIVVDEVHHGPAESYRSIFSSFSPAILLGLTATPERMDGKSVASDFANRFAAEIRLPEALEEKLLCPFHYFGVADPVALTADKFWSAGKYKVSELEAVYTGAHALAQQRVETILMALQRYEPDLNRIRAIGFCVSVAHAQYMGHIFNTHGIESAALTGTTESAERTALLNRFRTGELRVVFTCEVLSEGADIPEVNVVLFLRPTESLTVFLQQLGRGLRHSPEKDCLTVLDFVGAVHRRYRVDTKFKALLGHRRFNIKREVEMDFPHLPTGCCIQLDRLAKEYVLSNIRSNLQNLAVQVRDCLESFNHEAGQELTFANFVKFHGYDPVELLENRTWSEWKASARLREAPGDPDLRLLRASLQSAAQISGPKEIMRLRRVIHALQKDDQSLAMAILEEAPMLGYYRLWGKPAKHFGFSTLKEALQRLAQNRSVLEDLDEVLEWAETESRVPLTESILPFPSALELHANYGSDEINAALGASKLNSAGQVGTGVLSFPHRKAYAALITFQKTETGFAPSAMFRDYPISRSLLHWETQARTSRASDVGQNFIHHRERGMTMLFFARTNKTLNGVTVPFTYLGPADLVSHESERPIQMIWKLRHEMPADLFEDNRQAG